MESVYESGIDQGEESPLASNSNSSNRISLNNIFSNNNGDDAIREAVRLEADFFTTQGLVKTLRVAENRIDILAPTLEFCAAKEVMIHFHNAVKRGVRIRLLTLSKHSPLWCFSERGQKDKEQKGEEDAHQQAEHQQHQIQQLEMYQQLLKLQVDSYWTELERGRLQSRYYRHFPNALSVRCDNDLFLGVSHAYFSGVDAGVAAGVAAGGVVGDGTGDQEALSCYGVHVSKQCDLGRQASRHFHRLWQQTSEQML